MKVSSSNKALQTLTNKIKRNDIIFTHKLQRRENCWSTRQKALLIDSLLRGYPVNPVYLVTDEKQAVIDGGTAFEHMLLIRQQWFYFI